MVMVTLSWAPSPGLHFEFHVESVEAEAALMMWSPMLSGVASVPTQRCILPGD